VSPETPDVLFSELAITIGACYARSMKAFVGEVDEVGLRRFNSEAAFPDDVLARYSRLRFLRPTTVVWAVLDDQDAKVIRERVLGGRHGDACALLLNRAVELLALGSALAPSPCQAGSSSSRRDREGEKWRPAIRPTSLHSMPAV
jgi:hypothetical protein